MDGAAPIEKITETLLPAGLRLELCVTGIAVSGDHELLQFRLDPGNAFERRGYVRRSGGTGFLIGISERYLPDGDRRRVCGGDGIPAVEVPDQLMTASGWAYTQDAGRDHWRDARQRLEPAWSDDRLAATAGNTAATAWAAQQRARQEHTTHYVYEEAGRFVHGNNPPGPGRSCFSVTMRADWAIHRDRETYPLETAPDAGMLRHLFSGKAPTRLAGPVQVTRVEHPWASAAVVVPFRPRQETARSSTANRGRRL